MKIYEPETKLYKALMHPARLAILDLLRDGEACVCHMEATFKYRQAYISQQLMVLREAGLLQDRREGWNVYYRVVRPEIYSILDSVRRMVGMPAAKLTVTPIACTCPNCKEHNTHQMNVPVEFQSSSNQR